MLRDDGEARRQRTEALERDLAAATRELDELRPRAERVARMEAESAALRRELESLRARRAPGHAERRKIFVIVGAVTSLAIAGSVLYATREIARVHAEMALAGRDALHELDDLRRTHAAEQARLEARARDAEERARAAEARNAIAPARPPSGEERTFVPLTIESRRVTVRGRRDVPRRCTAWISPQDGACRARVVCGDREVYPAPGDAGAFACEVRDGRFAFGVDPDGSAVDGDPRLLVQGAEGVIAVSDGPSSAWSVAIESAPF